MADDDVTPYGANGFGRTIYGVTAGESEVYEGTDYDRAEREAMNAYRRYYGKRYVAILADGGTWKHVQCYPHAVTGKPDLSTARVTDAGFCLHPQCGQINPLYCYCVEYMDAETRERYRTEYA